MSSLVANNMHEVLLHNDQLRWNMSQSLVLQGFTGKEVSLQVGVLSQYLTSLCGCYLHRGAAELPTHVQVRRRHERVRHLLQGPHPFVDGPHPVRAAGGRDLHGLLFGGQHPDERPPAGLRLFPGGDPAGRRRWHRGGGECVRGGSTAGGREWRRRSSGGGAAQWQVSGIHVRESGVHDNVARLSDYWLVLFSFCLLWASRCSIAHSWVDPHTNWSLLSY